jgi:hypothetical protein
MTKPKFVSLNISLDLKVLRKKKIRNLILVSWVFKSYCQVYLQRMQSSLKTATSGYMLLSIFANNEKFQNGRSSG